MKLRTALRAGPASRIAFTGAGGKTTALFSLARELREETGTVLVTTTTHFGADQVRLGDVHVILPVPGGLAAGLARYAGVVVVTGGPGVGGRIRGIDPEMVTELAHHAERTGLPLLVEADGSRMRPLKAPAAHEPVVPEFVDAVVVVAGLSGLGQPAGPEWVHRHERFCELAGLQPGEMITPAALATVLRAPDGGKKAVPAGARAIVVLNQADNPALQGQGRRIADELRGAYDAVLIASLRSEAVFAVHEPAAGIVLAAGASTRMGRPKQLLDWGGRPLVAHVARQALAAGCDPVVVVTGAGAVGVQAAVADLSVDIVHNPDWEAGQSGSVRAGVAAAGRAGSALFLLVDQPFVEATLIRRLIEAHAASLAPIVAPMIGDRRGNPVLFDRATFPDFRALTGDAGGRQLFSRYPVEWLPWHDERALLDLDTEDDYRNLVGPGWFA
ncbi:MAG TPA: selenium cofactor biosynthesis protein YqeC [Anaerolineales bacterium]|nr:selenium cofactor biosynthesis protein YqeC [Anaerolineales bacterium]